MPLFGPPNVKKLKARRDVGGLIKALGYQKDLGVRKAAAVALGDMRDQRAVAPLIDLLMDRYMHDEAAGALIAIGPAAVESLVKLLKSPDWRKRSVVVDVLVAIGVPAVAALIDALRNHRSCTLSARALGQIGDTRAVEPLIKLLTRRSRKASPVAARALGRLSDPRAISPLTGFLGDDRLDFHQAAAEALVAIYKSGKLSEADKRTILLHRDTIMKTHHDFRTHRGQRVLPGDKCAGEAHVDTITRVDFSL